MDFLGVILLLCLILYGIAFYLVSRRLVGNLEVEADEKLDFVNQRYRDAVKKKDTLFLRRTSMEEEAFKVFTLYEITKDITKSLSEDEAFNIFRNKLREHVYFSECHIERKGSDQLKKYEDSKDYFIFELKSQDREIGFLILKDVEEGEEEKVRILGQQFALAMRRVKLYQEIGLVAITDSLTGVYTRRHTLERLNEEVSRAKSRKMSMGYLMVDADHFKSINDKHGHIAGDLVLREIGNIIKNNIREIDIAGRYGGEEFCVVLPDTDRDGAMYAAERIRQACESALIKVYDIELKITVSIGLAVFPDDAKTDSELIDKADWALYRSKKMGRNRVSSFGVFKKD